MFLHKNWPRRLLLLPRLKSDAGSRSGFSKIFHSVSGSGYERKKQNPAGVDSGTPDQVPPPLAQHEFPHDQVHWTRATVLNMIRFPDRDPTRFCNSEPDPDRPEFRKTLNRTRFGHPNCIDHCSKMLDQNFLGYRPDWIKYLDRSAGLGSERITQWKFWTGVGLQKSPICSTIQQRCTGVGVSEKTPAGVLINFWIFVLCSSLVGFENAHKNSHSHFVHIVIVSKLLMIAYLAHWLFLAQGRADSTGPTNRTCSEKIWEPLM